MILSGLNKIAEGKVPRRVLWDPSFYNGPRQSFLCLSLEHKIITALTMCQPGLAGVLLLPSCILIRGVPAAPFQGAQPPLKSWMVPGLTAVVRTHQPTRVFRLLLLPQTEEAQRVSSGPSGLTHLFFRRPREGKRLGQGHTVRQGHSH